MTTVGEAVASLSRNLLIARSRELEIFRHWLHQDATPELLNVSGPPGVGKTSLLQAFTEEAAGLGRRVVAVDGQSFGGTPQSLVSALSRTGSHDIDAVIAELNEDRAVVVLDTFDAFEHLTQFLQQQLLPHLDTSIRVAIATRRPLVLAWHPVDGWQKIVRLISLEGFANAESRCYLLRRGVDSPELIEQVVRATAGNPLALSLAADIVVQFGVRDFANSSPWRLAARSLISRLVSEASGDPALVRALEACSLVRVFDEATLAAMTEEDGAALAFDRLCALSVVKPTVHGLTLHDQVRSVIAEDLAWRRPTYHQQLRKRALDHFRKRLHGSSAEERAWLIGECFFLWGNTLIRDLFFQADAGECITVEPASSGDATALRDLYVESLGGKASQDDMELLESALGHETTRVRVARMRDGSVVGFSTVVPLFAESLGFLRQHPVHACLLDRFLGYSRSATVPAGAMGASAYYLLHVIAAEREIGAARSALLRDVAGIFGLGGTYLCTTREPLFQRLLMTCGFELLASRLGDDEEPPSTGWMLDLTRIGFEPWIEGVIGGSRPQGPPDSARLQSELLGALMHWNDGAWLTVNCPILAGNASIVDRPVVVKVAVEEALARARADNPAAMEQAFRALELAYMNRRANHKEAMCKLAVSRATFYRLCKRAVRALADEMIALWRTPAAAA